jgi:hypothetical protein
VRGDVADLVRLLDHTLGIDEVAEPLREADLLGPGIARLVRDTDLLVPVGEQPEREVELLAERLVRLGCVEGDAEDLAVRGLERLGLVTQALALDRSAGRVGHRVPPEEDPATAQVGEGDGVPVLIADGEVGSRRAGLQHVASSSSGAP